MGSRRSRWFNNVMSIRSLNFAARMIRRASRAGRLIACIAGAGFIAAAATPQRAFAGEAPAFYRGINLNGPALVIDGREWEAGNAKSVSCEDAAFENQSVRLSPMTDDARAKMIRSSRWSPQGSSGATGRCDRRTRTWSAPAPSSTG